MTNVRAMAWHLFQHIVVAVTGGTVRLGYSADNGAMWTSAIGAPTASPLAVTGGIVSPGEFAASFEAQNYVYTTLDGINWASGGLLYGSVAALQDLRYDWSFPRTLIGGG